MAEEVEGKEKKQSSPTSWIYWSLNLISQTVHNGFLCLVYSASAQVEHFRFVCWTKERYKYFRKWHLVLVISFFVLFFFFLSFFLILICFLYLCIFTVNIFHSGKEKITKYCYICTVASFCSFELLKYNFLQLGMWYYVHNSIKHIFSKKK